MSNPRIEASLNSIYARVGKRVLDLSIAALVFAVFGIPMLLIAALIKLEDGGPVLYRQERVGRNGVPFALADAVVRIESRYNPRVSNGGAMGLMQIKPATARGVGFAGSATALYHPETNVAYGMKYLAQAYRMSGGDVCGTVMRYQSGTYSKHMSAANRAYCSKARAIMAQN